MSRVGHLQDDRDGGKGASTGPWDVSDERLAELCRAGVAQESVMYGRSGPQTSKGTG